MAAHNRRLKTATLVLGTDPNDIAFECQLKSYKIVNNTPDGEKIRTFCTDGEFIEETDEDYALELEFVSDWREDGISDYLWVHDQETIAFSLTHLSDQAEAATWTGSVKIKAPDVGGERGTTEMTSITLQCVDKPTYTPSY